jgi:hypothetical protein
MATRVRIENRSKDLRNQYLRRMAVLSIMEKAAICSHSFPNRERKFLFGETADLDKIPFIRHDSPYRIFCLLSPDRISELLQSLGRWKWGMIAVEELR